MLSATLQLRLGTLALDAELEVRPGELLALLGPNGSGKTTILRCLAGLMPIDAGRIVIDDDVVDDPSNNRFTEPERRSVGVVFQDHLLFGHMSVIENIAFGLRARRVDKAEARQVAARWLERLDLARYAAHHPGALSGGQAQRVALARALATNPRLLLLDEPLSALDAGARSAMRRDLRRHLESFGGMRVLVTHDPVDAYALADRVAILDAGRIVQTGSLAEVTAHPRSRYVADLVGINLVSGVITGGVLRTAAGALVVIADAPSGPSFAIIRPQSISLHRHLDEVGSPRNTWAGSITDIDRLGDRVRVAISGVLPLTAEITVDALESLGLCPGDTVFATAKATDLVAYPT